MTILSGPSMGPASGEKPKQLVVLCHGVGADGHDLIDFAPVFAPVMPDAFFIAPDAPEPFDMAPFGRQWFSIGDLDPAKLGDGVRSAARHLDAFLDAELARLGIADYMLVGFSQGAMTALFTGLRRKLPPRAILAYSGALIDPQSLASEIQNHAPVLLVHGEDDEVVPAFRSRDAAATLRAAGVPVELVISPRLGHGIDDAGLHAGVAMVERTLPGGA